MEKEKYYVSYKTVHKSVKGLAEKLISSSFNPDVIVAIGSGGFIPARIMKTFINRPIYAVGISYYGVDKKHGDYPTKIQWIDEVQEQIRGKKVLLIDEVDDTRATLAYCVGELLKYKPEEIAVLVLHNKLKDKDVDFPPEIKRYYAAEEIPDFWIKYPWDADDIDEHYKLEQAMVERHASRSK
ncbi:MAG: phosphoribosyltransferase [Sphaerochaetaceae bacterium]|jgi:hypoxanthine phosphoribosyltransferase|nr:phosphoribosyltransferase [Sphaerochaetaceae bacterium]